VKTAINVGGPGYMGGRNFRANLEFAIEAEKLGVDEAWSVEAWGMDGVAPLAYLGARTTRLQLGTGILQIDTRTPAMTAMTALTMAAITGNRFLLGLGVSGPQVIEGLHGQSFAQPLTRLRETIEIVRMAIRGEDVVYAGKRYVVPRPGGEGKPLRLAQPPNPGIPIYLATLSPKALELTGEIADGWLGTMFTPEHAEVHFRPLQKGAARAGRSLADLTLSVGVDAGLTADPQHLIDRHKMLLAFVLGAMGSPRSNFYAGALKRGGYHDAASEVQRLWAGGRPKAAVKAVPDELVLHSTLFGTEAMVRERIRKYRDVGVDALRIEAQGKDTAERLDVLGRVLELIKQECDVKKQAP
jgi:F420-dependent oxidoreductase-like protein